MNKEEIEQGKQCLNEIIQNTYSEEKAIKLDNLRDYMNNLESKLNKVTDKLKEDIDFLEFCRDRDMDSGYGEDEEDRAVRVYIESILNIIEGEKK